MFFETIPLEMSYQNKTPTVLNAVLDIAEKSKIGSLPSPDWIGESGDWRKYRNVSGIPRGLGLSMKYKKKDDEIRFGYAQEKIDTIISKLQSYNQKGDS